MHIYFLKKVLKAHLLNKIFRVLYRSFDYTDEASVKNAKYFIQ